jgi:hypothetical protein
MPDIRIGEKKAGAMIPAADPCDPSNYPPRSLVKSALELNCHIDWFSDPQRPEDLGPFLAIKDDFYQDPDQVRATALEQRFVQYYPPVEEHVGAAVAGPFVKLPGAWFSTALKVYKGSPVLNPFEGFRHASESVRLRISKVVEEFGERVEAATWHGGGDGWNGAYHLMNEYWKGTNGSVHHHYKAGDVVPRGWSGVVYLSPDASPSAGTSIWRERATGRCVATYGAKFDPDVSNYELALLVENRFNRLVLFREHVLHRAEHGFGYGASARLTQTFFFNTVRDKSCQ